MEGNLVNVHSFNFQLYFVYDIYFLFLGGFAFHFEKGDFCCLFISFHETTIWFLSKYRISVHETKSYTLLLLCFSISRKSLISETKYLFHETKQKLFRKRRFVSKHFLISLSKEKAVATLLQIK